MSRCPPAQMLLIGFSTHRGDFRWRLWLLIDRIDEVFAAAQRRAFASHHCVTRAAHGRWSTMTAIRSRVRFGIAIRY
jgi:hypothetical protein